MTTITIPNISGNSPLQIRAQIQLALELAHAGGGGTVMLESGVYEIDRAIDMLDGIASETG